MTLETVKAPDEIDAIVGGYHGDAFRILGPHAVKGDAWEIRAFVPDAAQIEAIPTHEKDKPKIKFNRLHDSGLFEGTTKGANRVYAYDLLITDYRGDVRRQRDPYSFLPTLGEMDLYLFGQGNERRIRVSGPAYANNGAFLSALARDGIGIAYEPDFIVGEDVRGGRLVPILRGFTGSVGAISVVYASRRHLSAKVRAFSEFLAQHFAGIEWSPVGRAPARRDASISD